MTDLGLNANPYFDSLSNDSIVAGSVRRTDVDAPAPALSDHGQVSTLPISGNAYARNNVGQTVGDAFGGGGRPTVPLEWTAQGHTMWPVPQGTVSASATAINDAGIGACTFTFLLPPNNMSVQRVARCNASGFTVLPDLGAGAFPWGINLEGYISGVSGTQEGRLDTAVVWTPDNQLLNYGPGTLYRINDAGQFAGVSGGLAIGGNLQIGPVSLPLPDRFAESAAFDVNTNGVLVGWASPPVPRPDPFIRHAMRWDRDGTAHDLKTADAASEYDLLEAHSINDHGEILATARNRRTLITRVVLLTPIIEPPAIAVLLNQTAFQPGQTLRVTLDLSNPGPMLTTDVYVGIILPDGEQVVFLTNLSPLEGQLTTLSSNPRLFARLLQGVSWPANLHATQENYWVYTRSGLEANGTYHLVVAWTKPNSLQDGSIDEGDILALDWKAFQFTGPASNLAAQAQEIRARHGTK